MGETERVMVLMLWGIKCKQISGTDFLHTSGNMIFFQVSKHENLVIFASEEHVPFCEKQTPYLFIFFLF